MNNETYYRYDDIQYALGVDEFDNPLPGTGRLSLRLLEFQVDRHTPKGVWLVNGPFVLDSARKKYAHPTQAAALESFVRRKERQIGIYKAKLQRAERALQMAINCDQQLLELPASVTQEVL